MILNEGTTFAAAPPEVRRAFLGGRADAVLLPAGFRLYKYTHHPMFKPDGTATPWWSSVAPLDAGDPGFQGSAARAGALDATPQRFARARNAVTEQWNRMDGLLFARLSVPAYGFSGRCTAQPVDEDPGLANVVFIGGAWQLWIPNLTRASLGP